MAGSCRRAPPIEACRRCFELNGCDQRCYWAFIYDKSIPLDERVQMVRKEISQGNVPEKVLPDELAEKLQLSEIDKWNPSTNSP